MAKKITNYIIQKGNILYAVKPFVLTIDLSQYDKNKIDIKEDKVWVKSLLSKAEFSDNVFDIVLDYTLELFVHEIENVRGEYLKLTYEQNSKVLEVSTAASESAVEISYVERLIGGRELLKDASHLYRKLLGVYGSLSDMDSSHLEILCSQVLRDKKDIQIPARLASKWDPILINLKKVVFSEGFINGLAFENINDAIKTGLINDEKEEPSIIEKVMTGTVVEDTKSKSSRLGDAKYRNR